MRNPINELSVPEEETIAEARSFLQSERELRGRGQLRPKEEKSKTELMQSC